MTIRDSLNDYSWDEISKIGKEIARAGGGQASINIAKTYNLVGSDGKLDGTQSKHITLSNGTETAVQIVGFAHDVDSSGQPIGITFAFADSITKMPWNDWNSTSGGWANSVLRQWMNGGLLKLVPDDLSKSIVPAKKRTNSVSYSDSTSTVHASTDKMWVPSFVEIVGLIDMGSYERAYEAIPSDQKAKFQGYIDIWNDEGWQYQLFSDTGAGMAKRAPILTRHDAKSGSAVAWWGRSIAAHDKVLHVDEAGQPHKSSLSANAYIGLVPFFCVG